MSMSKQLRPVSYLKAHAEKLVRELTESEPVVITQNGEARAVIQDIESYEETQKTLALLKVLALGSRQIEEGKVQPARSVFSRIRAKRKTS